MIPFVKVNGGMPAAYSRDLRERVIGLVSEGRSARSAAALLRVSPSTAVKWVQRWRRTGSSAPGRMGGRRSGSPLDAHRAFLNARMEAKPDIALSAVLEQLLQERGQSTSRIALSRFYRREGWRFKKKPARGRTRPA